MHYFYQTCSREIGQHVLLEQRLVGGVSSDQFALQNEKDWRLFSIICHNAKDHYFCWSLWEKGWPAHFVHIRHWQVCQMPAILLTLSASMEKSFLLPKMCILTESPFLNLMRSFLEVSWHFYMQWQEGPAFLNSAAVQPTSQNNAFVRVHHHVALAWIPSHSSSNTVCLIAWGFGLLLL